MRLEIVAAGITVAILVGACGSKSDQAQPDESSTTAATTTTAAPTTTATPSLAVKDSWAPASVPGATVGAVFLVVENPTPQPDALVAASVEPSVARAVQMQQQSAASGGDEHAFEREPGRPVQAVLAHGGQVQRLEVPAAATVTFDHDTGHLVLVGLVKPLVAGETFPMTLQFENAGTRAITVSVREG